jgi:hypothetical protein
MNADLLFTLANLGVMPFWLLMIFAPRRPWAVRVIRSPWIAIVPAAIYVLLVVPMAVQMGPALFGAFGSLDGIAALLGTPQAALVGWAHFLAFDLLVGRWAYLEAHERNISALVMAPVLLFILMLGPLGFVLYLLVRSAHALLRREAVPAAVQ